MQVLNYYRTMNNSRNTEVTINHVSMVELLPSAKEYKGFYIQGNYIIKDRVIIQEVVKPCERCIDHIVNKGVNLCEGKAYHAYIRPMKALSAGLKLIKQFDL